LWLLRERRTVKLHLFQRRKLFVTIWISCRFTAALLPRLGDQAINGAESVSVTTAMENAN